MICQEYHVPVLQQKGIAPTLEHIILRRLSFEINYTGSALQLLVFRYRYGDTINNSIRKVRLDLILQSNIQVEIQLPDNP